MGRYNGTFKYKVISGAHQNAKGFWVDASESDWIEGGVCRIEKHIPAKQIKGVDGVLVTYVYEIFLPKECDLDFPLGTPLMLTTFKGSILEEVVITGFDNSSKKHVLIWA